MFIEEKIATGIKVRLDIIPIERADLMAIQMSFACLSERLVRRRNHPLPELFMR